MKKLTFLFFFLFSCNEFLGYAQTPNQKYMSATGTIFLYANTIKSDDYSTFETISSSPASESTVKMFDREAQGGKGDWISPGANVYEVKFNDKLTTKIRVRENDFSPEAEKELAKNYAFMMGQLPACLRKGVQFINLMKGDREWGGNSSTKALDIQIGKISDSYKAQGIMEETLVHESCHAALDPLFYGKADWNTARNKDTLYISQYAYDNKDREDVAESFVPYLAAKYRKCRISADQAAEISSAIKNRMTFFDEKKLDLNPISTAVLRYQPSMKLGERLLEGEKLLSANGKFQLRGTPEGNFVIEEVACNRAIYNFPLAGPINNPPAVSWLSYNPDGNICIGSKQNKGYCATNGIDAVTPVIIYKSERATLTNDGRFVLINKQGDEIWAAK